MDLTVLNRDEFEGDAGRKSYDAASGVSVIDGEAAFNGGIINPRRAHLSMGQWYFRFVSSATPHAVKVGGAWWVDYETLHNIWRRYEATGANPNARRIAHSSDAASTFREWLALTYEWNLIQEMVVAQLARRMDAWAGVGRVARGAHVFDNRSFGYAPHLSKLFEIRQNYIPGMRKHAAAAFPAPRVLPFARVADIASGKPF